MRFHRPRSAAMYPPDDEDAAQSGAPTRGQASADSQALSDDQAATDDPNGKQAMFLRQLDRWLAAMERLRLSDYVRYVDDRKRLFWTSFWGGVARGVGMAVGFTILGAVLVLILQDLAKHNLPLIGDTLAQIVSIVQKRLE